jgi:hypothetical protein
MYRIFQIEFLSLSFVNPYMFICYFFFLFRIEIRFFLSYSAIGDLLFSLWKVCLLKFLFFFFSFHQSNILEKIPRANRIILIPSIWRKKVVDICVNFILLFFFFEERKKTYCIL